MSKIRVYTTLTCPHCRDAKAWLKEHDCEFEELDITADVEALRDWRALSGGVGVPVIAHGNDFIVGFSPERLAQFVDCCRHTTLVEPAGASG